MPNTEHRTPNTPAGAMSEPVAAKPLAEQSVHSFLESLAAKTPAPGGGSVAALTGALAAAQAAMTVAYTVGKPRFQSMESELRRQDEQLKQATTRLEALMEEDRSAYEALNSLMKIPAASRPADRFAAAIQAAIDVPRAVATTALEVLASCQGLRDKINPMLASDLRIAALLARAAVEASRQNVLVNTPLLAEPEAAQRFANEAADFCRQADERLAKTLSL